MTKFARPLFFYLLCFASLSYSVRIAADTGHKPSVDLEADEVIRIVVEALRTNDPNANDDGIATVFRFASPDNKSVTGPLNRFTNMVKRGFGVMLNHTASEFSPLELQESTARQAVWLTALDGQQHGFMFELGKQSKGEFKGMWMTNSVWPLGVRKGAGQSI